MFAAIRSGYTNSAGDGTSASLAIAYQGCVMASLRGGIRSERVCRGRLFDEGLHAGVDEGVALLRKPVDLPVVPGG